MRAGWQLVEAFCAWQIARAFSANTVRRRRSSLNAFRRFIAPADLVDATTELVEDFLASHDTPRTKRAYRSDLAMFYRWALRRGVVQSNPVDAVESIRVPRSLPRPVPADAVPALIATAPTEHVRRAIALAAYAGLRRAEISALRADDIRVHMTRDDTDQIRQVTMIEVRDGKGGKDRTVPMHPELRTMLAGARGRIVPLTPDVIGRQAAAHLRDCGYDMTLHQLRHTFGTVMAALLAGDLMVLGGLMGHADPNTTKGYAMLTDTRGAGAIEIAYGRELRSAS